MGKVFKFIILAGIITSCNLNNNQYNNQLKNLDAKLEDHPEMVLDSLKRINTNKLDESQQAYYHLLYASATDKNLIYLDIDTTLLTSLEYYTDHKDHYNIARCQYYLGKYAHKRGQSKQAYELFKQAETNAKQSEENIPHLLGLIYYQQGLILKQDYNYPEVEALCQKSFDKFMVSKDTVSAVYALKLKGNVEINQKKYNEAKENLYKSLELINSINNNTTKTILAKNTILLAISYYHRAVNNLPEALQYLKTYSDFVSHNNQEVPYEYYYNAMCTYKNMNQLDSVKYYNQKMVEVAKKEKSTNNLISAYKFLSYFAEQEGNYKEACSLKTYANKLKDSLNNTVYQNNLLELERKYDNSEAKRLVLKAENNKLKAYIVIAIIILGGATIGFSVYKRHRKLKMKCDRLSEAVKHTEWGFLVTKEFITENHIAYDELERMLNREKGLNLIDTEFYNRFHDALIQQKANYSGRLFNRLTNFDGTFGAKFQQLFPDFNTDELLMASMIHHQWKTADMTTIFHASADAIRKRKTRLANKISAKLQKDIDLDEFLSNL